MFVTFYSNFLNDHQIPFCNAMYRLLNGNFRFVATTPMDAERVKMKFKSDEYPYEVRSYENDEAQKEAQRLADESDVVILGAAPIQYIYNRLRNNKLTYRYSERYFKRGRWRIFDPRVIWNHYKNDFRYRNKPYYMLCAGAYTAPDCRFIHSYPGKCLKWGYFPEVKTYDIDSLMTSKHSDIPELLWVGRMIDWKHPENAVKVAKHLKERDFPFHMTIIGEGPERKRVEDLINKYNLQQHITVLDFMPHEQVRQYMERANIFLFTSDRQEGWGAVLNEAMNSGCAVIANDEIGAVPFMIDPGKNGLTYHKRVKDFCQLTEQLLSNPSEIEALGRNAYATMHETWNADNAADRFLDMCHSLLSQTSPNKPTSGPMSKA